MPQRACRELFGSWERAHWVELMRSLQEVLGVLESWQRANWLSSPGARKELAKIPLGAAWSYRDLAGASKEINYREFNSRCRELERKALGILQSLRGACRGALVRACF